MIFSTLNKKEIKEDKLIGNLITVCNLIEFDWLEGKIKTQNISIDFYLNLKGTTVHIDIVSHPATDKQLKKLHKLKPYLREKIDNYFGRDLSSIVIAPTGIVILLPKKDLEG